MGKRGRRPGIEVVFDRVVVCPRFQRQLRRAGCVHDLVKLQDATLDMVDAMISMV